MYAPKSYIFKLKVAANIHNILQLCQDQSTMLHHATAEKKY